MKNELQLDVVAAIAMPRRLDALFMIIRESTRLVSERRQFRDGVRSTQETRYQPANLVPDQPRMASREEVPKWSMLQVNYKREEVTGDASPPKVGRLRHQTEERNLKLLE